MLPPCPPQRTMHLTYTSFSLDRGNATTTRPASRPLPQSQPPTTTFNSSQPGNRTSRSPQAAISWSAAHLVKFEPIGEGLGSTQDHGSSPQTLLRAKVPHSHKWACQSYLHGGWSICRLGLLGESLAQHRWSRQTDGQRLGTAEPCYVLYLLPAGVYQSLP